MNFRGLGLEIVERRIAIRMLIEIYAVHRVPDKRTRVLLQIGHSCRNILSHRAPTEALVAPRLLDVLGRRSGSLRRGNHFGEREFHRYVVPSIRQDGFESRLPAGSADSAV